MGGEDIQTWMLKINTFTLQFLNPYHLSIFFLFTYIFLISEILLINLIYFIDIVVTVRTRTH